MRCLLRLGLPAVLLGALVPARAQSAAPDFRPAPGKPPLLKAAAIREASGLAVSSRNNGFLWIVNDSVSAPDLHLVQRLIGPPVEWMGQQLADLASFVAGPEPI